MVYLDYASTEKMSLEAFEKYKEVAFSNFGNAGSTHKVGRDAARQLEGCRKACLKALGIEKTHDVIFTSGATESNNMALKSIALHYQNRGKRIISSSAEHASVLSSLAQLKNEFGFDVIELDAKANGSIDVNELKENIDKNTIIVSLIGVNNETGAISPIKEVSEIVSSFPKCFFHCDATQAIGKANIDYSRVDLVSLSAHKFGGPKGVGLLAYRKNISFLPLLSGGVQEHFFRSGTQDLPAIASMTVALERTMKAPYPDKHVALLANKVRDYVSKNPAILSLNSPNDASDFIVNFSFLIHKASVVLEALSEKEIYVSSVSACSSKTEPVSHVLLSMGLDKGRAMNSMRVSFSRESKEEEVDLFLSTLDSLLKELSPR